MRRQVEVSKPKPKPKPKPFYQRKTKTMKLEVVATPPVGRHRRLANGSSSAGIAPVALTQPTPNSEEPKILLRGDGGFCREKLMAWCEREGMDYIFGLAQNPRLKKLIEAQMAQVEQQYEETKTPARVFTEFFYATEKTWSRERRVVAKAEHLDKGSN